MSQHIPVLYQEVLDALQPRSGGRYIDATVGGGGHAEGILQASSPEGLLLGLDADAEAIERVRRRLAPFGHRLILEQANFRRLAQVAQAHGFDPVDGILLDLGVSSFHLEEAGRGFSFQSEGPLDMRMDRSQDLSAADVVNGFDAETLADILYRYGEERHSRRIARAIVQARPLHTTAELAAVVERALGGRRGTRIHPATRTFQALRIFVNDELGALQEALPQALSLLRPGGVLAVISFHSLEDRIVKQFFRRESRDCICPPEVPVCRCNHQAQIEELHRRGITPTPDEIQRNPRSRSARLRIARKRPPF
ncbi:MAG: 16S rRNA (cytosine(1402)-N(4))-methyltransferase RsmH [Caldilineae bacterium]|nr:MAG: 16S rRNA (cytosine(1402)-N(4))-methyltransferase RsmH [Caldilineae bacterium]